MLWWGRFDPEYSRNRILRSMLPSLGWQIIDYHPILSATADVEAMLRRLPKPDLVWVPCFRQRDLVAARKWSRDRGIPLVFDPLISAYDKQVFEREKVGKETAAARRLLAWESKLFQMADRVIADTTLHAEYFSETLGVQRERLWVVYVGAEEPLFGYGEIPSRHTGILEVLFYGSFNPLHGTDVIAEAARLYKGPPVNWRFIGKGPSRDRCETLMRGLDNVIFEDWVSYHDLPSKIRQADIVLGIFGTTPKASRVIPNKVFQALACGRIVITRHSSAYPEQLRSDLTSGVIWVDAGSSTNLCERLSELANCPEKLMGLSENARKSYQRYFSNAVLAKQLTMALSDI